MKKLMILFVLALKAVGAFALSPPEVENPSIIDGPHFLGFWAVFAVLLFFIVFVVVFLLRGINKHKKSNGYTDIN